MKLTILILILLLTGSVSFAQKEKTSGQNQGKQQDTKITPGASGVKRSIGYRFSSETTDKDPGKGIFRYNNDNVAEVTRILVDDIDIKDEDQTKWYRTWEDSTGASGRGQIIIVALNGENVNVFNFTDVFIDGNGYWKFPVQYVSGRLPHNDSVYYYIFNRIAHTGRDGGEVEEVEEAEEVEEVKEPVVVAEAPVVEEAPEVPVEEEVEEVEEIEEITEPAVIEEVMAAEAALVIPVEVPVAEPVIEVKAEEAPVVIVPVAEPVAEAVSVVPAAEPSVPEKTEEDTSETSRILSKKTRVPEKPGDSSEPKTDQGTQKIPDMRPDEGTVVTETKPPETKPLQSTTVAQGPPRVTETRQPSQQTTVTQSIPATQPAGETTQEPVTRPVQGTRISEVPSTKSYTASSGKSRGKCYRGIIELGYGLSVSEYGMNNFRFNFINGFNIRNTSVGLGIGVRKFYDKPAKHPEWHLVSPDIQIPVFLDIRTHFSSKKVTPYLGIGIGNSTGYDSDTTNNKPEGMYFHATGGIWFNLSDRFAVFGGFAYETQRLRYANFSDEIIYNKFTNSLSLNIGIAF